MKKVLLCCLLASICTVAKAQKHNHSQKVKVKVSKKAVIKDLKYLSSDALAGRSALEPEKLNLAADYIKKRFNKLGLLPMPGASSFEQFTDHKVKANKKYEVIIDGKVLSADNYIIKSAATSTVLDSSNTEVRLVAAGKSLGATFGNLRRSTANLLVFVDSSHVQTFNGIKEYLDKNTVTKSNEKGNLIFVLGQKQTNNFKVSISQNLENAGLKNIIGYLPGKTKPEEFVVFSAHYDHIGTLLSMDGDSIANGADDDASGTTAVLTLAKHFAKKKNNERSILFIAFTAEELGLLGSEYFGTTMDASKVVAMANIEMIGKPSKWGKGHMLLTGFERSNLGDLAQENLCDTDYYLHPDPYTNLNLFYRSDNASMARLGVPAHTFSTDKIDADELYHTVNDEFESLDMDNVVTSIKTIAKAMNGIIQNKQTPSRVKPE
jgi:Zn-dependent M28 family amino/carboxypeptidase